MDNSLITTQLYIDGRYVDATNGETYDIYNPAKPTELIGYAARADINNVSHGDDQRVFSQKVF